jgi:prephenate dehydratase
VERKAPRSGNGRGRGRPTRYCLTVPRIAYLGPEGTFTEAALIQMAAAGLIPDSDPVVPVPTESIRLAVAAVRDGQAAYACVPIENSIEGSILPTLDSLATGSPLQIFAEHTLDVAFSIVVRPGRSVADIRTVAAFPVAVAQVRHWLNANLPGIELIPANSNAAAAQDVSAGRADAAVSTALAAERYGLTALAAGVVDEPNAATRFALAGLPAPPPTRTGADRTSVVLRIENVPGALVSAMTEFGIRDIDLTRIESRPTRTELGTYVFFLDCVGHIDDSAVAEALKALHRRCADVRYLGSWPTGSASGAVPPQLDEASRWLAQLREGTGE